MGIFAFFLKHGPNWALFNLASLYWRALGDGYNSIECLRRAIHFAPSDCMDVGFIGLANTLHRHLFLNSAVIVARAALDMRPESVRVDAKTAPQVTAHFLSKPVLQILSF